MARMTRTAQAKRGKGQRPVPTRATGADSPSSRPGWKQVRLRHGTIDRLVKYGNYTDSLDDIVSRLLDAHEQNGRSS